jgi:hypothetical protein
MDSLFVFTPEVYRTSSFELSIILFAFVYLITQLLPFKDAAVPHL